MRPLHNRYGHFKIGSEKPRFPDPILNLAQENQLLYQLGKLFTATALVSTPISWLPIFRTKKILSMFY